MTTPLPLASGYAPCAAMIDGWPIVAIAFTLTVCVSLWMLRSWFGPCRSCGSKSRPYGDIATETCRCPDCDVER